MHGNEERIPAETRFSASSPLNVESPSPSFSIAKISIETMLFAKVLLRQWQAKKDVLNKKDLVLVVFTGLSVFDVKHT